MRNIFLSVVVVSALVIAGVGGTLAGFSDTEMSENNYFEVGSLDLKVSKGTDVGYNDGDFYPPHEGIGPLIMQTPIWPCQSSDWNFDIHNVGDPEGKLAYCYIHFKDFVCYEVLTTKVPDGRPEPEDVSELGGWLANQVLPGIGEIGADCTLDNYIEVAIYFDVDRDGTPELILGDDTWADPLYLGELECFWIYLDQIEVCEGPVYGKISLHISNIPEDDFGYDIFADDMPFDHWPTNALMNDGVNFTVEWALTEEQMPARVVYVP